MTPEQQIEKLQAEVARLKAIVSTDPLTGLANRRGITERLQPMIKEVSYQMANPQRRKLQIDALSVVMVDIDKFKDVNDTHGHASGDKVLKQLAKVLTQHVRSLDVVGRLGGEEFVVAFLGADGPTGARLAEQLRAAVEVTKFSAEDGTALDLTASFGVASLTESDQSIDELLARADKALYEAKITGRNKVVVAKG